MGLTERHINPTRRLKRNWHLCTVDADGEVIIAKISGVRGSKSASMAYLDEVHNEATQHVDSFAESQSAEISAMASDIVTEAVRSLFLSDGRAMEAVNYQTLECMRVRVAMSVDQEGNAIPFAYDNPFGLPQSLSSTIFPPPTGVSGSDSGAGTVADGTYYIHVIPAYVCQDPVYAPVDTFNLTNYAAGAFIRGFHYTLGTPAVSSSFSVSGGSSAVAALWTAPVLTDATTGAPSAPRPTHMIVCLSTSASLDNAATKVSAIVAWGTLGATITAIGATTFGSAPSAADLYDARGLDETTDWVDNSRVTFDAAEGTWQWSSDANARVYAGTPLKLTAWRVRDTYTANEVGGGTVSADFRFLRLRLARTNDPDPVTRRATAVWLDFPKVNIAKLASDLLTQGETGFHDPLPFTLPVLLDPSYGYLCKQYGEHADARNFADFFSGEYDPVNV